MYIFFLVYEAFLLYADIITNITKGFTFEVDNFYNHHIIAAINYLTLYPDIVTSLLGKHLIESRIYFSKRNFMLIFYCSCSICTKKQNHHFIVPKSKFRLIQGQVKSMIIFLEKLFSLCIGKVFFMVRWSTFFGRLVFCTVFVFVNYVLVTQNSYVYEYTINTVLRVNQCYL